MKTTSLFLFWLLAITTGAFAQVELWGTTRYGGDFGIGCVFKTNYDGSNQQVIHSFMTQYPGIEPTGDLVQASNGKYYGYSSGGGTCGYGNLFEYDGNFVVLFNFDLDIYGGYVYGTPLLATNSKIYGVTAYGGPGNAGTIFEYDPATQTMTVLNDFSTTNIIANNNGSLIQAQNGKLYGLGLGGNGGGGVIYEYDITSGILLKLYDFPASGVDGFEPWGSLVEGTNGKLYGLAGYGGTDDYGVLFEYDIATSTFTKKADFTDLTGKYPYGNLMEASNGKFYGYASEGGNFSNGTIVEFDPATSTLIAAIHLDATLGGYPLYGTLCEAPNGKLYGMTSSEGVNFMGTLFEFDPVAQTAVLKVGFDCDNGGYPTGGLMLASNGNLYGMTSGGGSADAGTMLEYNYNTNALTTLVEFNSTLDGSLPAGGLTLASNGKMYGIAETGGAQKTGVIFEIDPQNGTQGTVASFDTSNGGYQFQYGGFTSQSMELCAASNGKLYGVCPNGGSNSNGSLFEFDPATNSITKKIDFTSAIDGNRPGPGLMQASNGKLYGTCYYGGLTNKGTLFSYDISSGIIDNLFDFDDVNGAYPNTVVSELSPGRLFGCTTMGGANNKGVIYIHDITQASTVKVTDFSIATGAGGGTIMEATNGTFYLMNTLDGANSQGAICSFDSVSQTVTVLHDFDGTNAITNRMAGNLTEVNGKLYAMRQLAGVDYNGDIFEFDLATNTYTQKLDFSCNKGARPEMISLTKINKEANSLVWPGDCNFDLTANNVDLLWMNLAFGSTGTTRSGGSNVWTGQTSSAWSGAFANTVNHKHADSNGDGVVSNADTVAISLNYGQTHPLRLATPVLLSPSGDISLVSLSNAVAPGSAIDIEIHLGTPGSPIDSLYGIAFTLEFDPTLVSPSQTFLTLTPSVLGTMGANMESLQKYFPAFGRIEAAVCRNDHTNQANVNGVIGVLHLVASAAVTSLTDLIVTPSTVSGVTVGQQQLTFTTTSDTVAIDPALIGMGEVGNSDGIYVYPNPASSVLYINSGETPVLEFSAFDSRGTRVAQARGENEIRVDTWESGFYFLDIVTQQGVVHRKVLVE